MANDFTQSSSNNHCLSSNFETFEDIDFSEFQTDDHSSNNSPTHDNDSQSSSGLFSPIRLEDEDELDHDADSDSSGEHSSFKTNRTQDRRKTKRRTSSHVFTFKENNDFTDVANNDVDINDDFLFLENEKNKLSSGGLRSRRDLLKWTTSQSFSSSTEEYDLKSKKTSQAMKLDYANNDNRHHQEFSTSGSEEIYSKNTLVNIDNSPKSKAVDGLLFEIYDKYHHHNDLHQLLDSDITELSTTSVTSIYVASSFENDDRAKLDKNYLETKELSELERMVKELKRGISMLNSKLVRYLKQRDRNAHKIQENFNVLTALLQARSQKRRVDTRIRFSFIPRPGKQGFRQWVDALKAISRIQDGIPSEWRKRTWLSLAEFFLKEVEWETIKKMCFNDKRNPDDDELDTQIVKDLHRTGCGWFFEHDTAEDRASLKRVLLAYARWNKRIGYCQGFNVIAALILQVMEGNEEHALKVMIYLVDYILPRNYFSNNLRALSVDMAVLRDLMQIKLGGLARKLQQLQKDAMSSEHNTSASYEPPLINMFTMQWFLTLFATCLPRDTVLRIWDTVLLEGSEVLLRVALSIWAKLESFFDQTSTASDFYMTMGKLIQNLMTDDFIPIEKLMQTLYQMAPFPWSDVTELREKYTYDIHPFSTFRTDKKKDGRKSQQQVVQKLPSDEEELDENNDDVMVGCLGFVAGPSDNQLTLSPNKQKMVANRSKTTAKKKSIQRTDITKISPGAYITDQEARNAYKEQMRAKELMRETEKLDLGKLRDQYGRMRRLQHKAMLVFNAEDFKDDTYKMKNPPSAINHLFVDVHNVTAPPRARYRKPSNFPALKAPSKGGSVPGLPKPKSSVSDESTAIQKRRQSDSFSITNPYIMMEVQGERQDESAAFKDPDAHARMVNKSAAVNTIKTAPSKTLSAPIKKDDNSNGELKSLSPLYQIDKSALYPSNFKPFPKRNIGKRIAQGK